MQKEGDWGFILPPPRFGVRQSRWGSPAKLRCHWVWSSDTIDVILWTLRDSIKVPNSHCKSVLPCSLDGHTKVQKMERLETNQLGILLTKYQTKRRHSQMIPIPLNTRRSDTWSNQHSIRQQQKIWIGTCISLAQSRIYFRLNPVCLYWGPSQQYDFSAHREWVDGGEGEKGSTRIPFCGRHSL